LVVLGMCPGNLDLVLAVPGCVLMVSRLVLVIRGVSLLRALRRLPRA